MTTDVTSSTLSTLSLTHQTIPSHLQRHSPWPVPPQVSRQISAYLCALTSFLALPVAKLTYLPQVPYQASQGNAFNPHHWLSLCSHWFPPISQRCLQTSPHIPHNLFCLLVLSQLQHCQSSSQLYYTNIMPTKTSGKATKKAGKRKEPRKKSFQWCCI